MDRNVASLIIALLCIVAVIPACAGEFQVGVKPADWIKYDCSFPLGAWIN